MAFFTPGYAAKLRKLTADNLAIAASYSFEAVMALAATAVLMLLPDKSVYVDAVAGVSAMFSAAVVISAFQRGMTETALTKVSKRHADGDRRGVWQMMVDTVSLNLVGTLFLLAVFTLLADQVLLVACGSESVAQLVKPIFLMGSWSYIVELPGFAISINMRGTDDVKWAARFPFIRETVYVLLLLACVPTLGVIGVGVAIVATRIVITSVQLYVVFSGRSNMSRVPGVKIDGRHMLAILKKGFPLSLKFMFTRAGGAVVGGCIGAVSVVGLAAVNICLDVITILEGVEHANKLNTQVLVAAGAGGRRDGVRASGTYALVAGGLLWVAALLLAGPVSMFATDDADVAAMMVYVMPALAPYLFFDAFDNFGLGILQGLDRQGSIGLVTVITTLTVNIALPLLLVHVGADVLWVASLYAVNVIVRAVIWGMLSARALRAATTDLGQ